MVGGRLERPFTLFTHFDVYRKCYFTNLTPWQTREWGRAMVELSRFSQQPGTWQWFSSGYNSRKCNAQPPHSMVFFYPPHSKHKQICRAGIAYCGLLLFFFTWNFWYWLEYIEMHRGKTITRAEEERHTALMSQRLLLFPQFVSPPQMQYTLLGTRYKNQCGCPALGLSSVSIDQQGIPVNVVHWGFLVKWANYKITKWISEPKIVLPMI